MIRSSLLFAFLTSSVFGASCAPCAVYGGTRFDPTFNKTLIQHIGIKNDCTAYAPDSWWVNYPAENFSSPSMVPDIGPTGKSIAFTYSNGTVFKMGSACVAAGTIYYFNKDGVPVVNSEYAKSLFTDPNAIVGTGLIMSGYLLTAAGAVATSLGATGFGVSAIGMLGTAAMVVGVGSVIYAIASNSTLSSNTYVAPSNAVQTETGRIKVSLTASGDTQIVKTDSQNRPTEITTVPKTVMEKLSTATVDRNTKLTSMVPSDVQGVQTVYYNYDTSTASTSTLGSSSPAVDTSFSYSTNSDGTVSVTSSNPSVAPNYNGSTETVSSVSNSTNTSTGTNSGSYDTSVPVSDAAGTNGDNLSPVSFGTSGDISLPDESLLDTMSSNYSEAFTNFSNSYSSVITSYDHSKDILEHGLDSSRISRVNTQGSCDLSFHMLGRSAPIDLSFFSFLYPLFYAIIFIAMHYLGIRIYINGAKLGNN
jgi:hypothetical protein